jgi:hypothetical protein
MTACEYIWIAESDDNAHPTLLCRSVERLASHPTVGMAVCESMIVNENDNHLGVYSELMRASETY